MNNTTGISSSMPIRILYVDDDADFLEISKQIIKTSSDFEVDYALSVDEAFEKLKNQTFDVVLSDYKMLPKDGLQFLRELRLQKNDIAFILFTGKGREDVAITALNLGADGYYDKHGSPETVFGELLHGIKNVTDERRIKRAFAEREKHYRILMDQAADIILMLEYPKEGPAIIRDANTVALQIHGYTMDELYGKPITFIDNYFDEKKLANIADDVKQGKSVTFETFHKRKDGSVFNVEVYIKGVAFGPEIWAIAIERDITSRKRDQEALRSSEARYRALFEQAGDYILLMEIPLGQLPIIRDANAAALRALGYSKEEIIGKPFSFVDVNVDLVKTDNLVQKLRQKRKCTFESIHRRKDGSMINIEALIKAVKIGTDIWFLAIERDITDRKRAEEALKRSEAHFRALFDHAVDCIFIVELNNEGIPTIRDANPSALKIHGYTREELIGKPQSLIDKSVTPESAQNTLEKLSDAPIIIRSKHQRKDSSVFDVEASIIKMVLDNKAVAVSFERNITDQNNLEAACRLGDARFRAVYDNSYDAVVLMKPDGKIVSANETACRMFGYTENELRNIGRDGIIVIDERARRVIHERENTGQAKAELTFRRKDGSAFEGDLTSTLFTEPNGNPGVCMIIRDITPRKNAEEVLKESSQKIGTMNEKLRVVGGLTRHDVKNKLSIINANVYLLRKRLSSDSEVAKYLDAITTAVTSSDKLLEFSRLYEKIGAEQLTDINVEECFNEAVALMPNLVGINIINECKGVTVMADSLLRQLFYNLLDNSQKHGIKVTEIKLHCTKSEEGIKLLYEDNGIGISHENKLKLFTEGFTTGNGSGLGLRLAKKMVEVYGWSITETGIPGNGVKFEISIK